MIEGGGVRIGRNGQKGQEMMPMIGEGGVLALRLAL